MKKVFRKMRLTTNVKLMKRSFVFVLVLSICAMAIAATKDDEDSVKTKKLHITDGYYCKGEFSVEVECEYKLFSKKVTSGDGVAKGEAIWSGINSDDVDWAYIDLALPYSVLQFTYYGGAYTTSSSPWIPIWESQSPGTLKCTRVKQTNPRLWDYCSGSVVPNSKVSSITAKAF